MKLDQLSGRRTLAFGFIASVLGIVIILKGVDFTKLAIDLLSAYFFFVGLFNIFLYIFMRKKEISLISDILGMILSFVLVLLNRATSLPVNFVIIILGIYQLATACIYGITYYLYRKNKVKGGLRYLMDTLLYGGIGLTTVISPATDGRWQFLFLGIYLMMLGISNMRDGFFFHTDLDKKGLRRQIRINLPVIVAAFIPFETLNRFNHFLQGKSLQENTSVYSLVKNPTKKIDLEVLVHTSKESFFGAIGHVDICYQGQVISYGNYDPFSERLFSTIGDGVLFKADKDAYIELCRKESKKTLFGYSLSLTAEQKKAVEERLAEIDALLEVWQPSNALKDGQHIYAYRLKHELGAHLYKFKSSRFKSYFVLSTNCCLLADSIVGQAGTAILDIRGIIAPGTYQNYLQYEFESANDLVVAQTVYQ